LLDEHLASVKPESFIFETVHGGPPDPRGLAAMEALESAVCNQRAADSADDKTAGAVN
jgi:hypothetical protein